MNNKNKMNILNLHDSLNFVVCGTKYRGEVLIVDFNIDEGIEEDKFYVVLNNGDIVEVVNND